MLHVLAAKSAPDRFKRRVWWCSLMLAPEKQQRPGYTGGCYDLTEPRLYGDAGSPLDMN